MEGMGLEKTFVGFQVVIQGAVSLCHGPRDPAAAAWQPRVLLLDGALSSGPSGGRDTNLSRGLDPDAGIV